MSKAKGLVMRRLIWIFVILAIFWVIWWSVVGFGMKSAQTLWFEERRQAGWQADYKTLDLSGFPSRVRSEMTDIQLADTDNGLALSLPTLGIGVPTYWPGDVTLSLPQDPITISTINGKSTLQLENAVADLMLHPSPSLELENLSALADHWQLSGQGGLLVEAQSLQLRMTQNSDDAKTYHFIAEADQLRPGDVPRLALKLPQDWPKTFDIFTLNAEIAFDKPWDLSAIEQSRPQPRVIKLKLAEAKWADLRLFFAADLEIDDSGVPTGQMNIQAENWQAMLDMGTQSGVLPEPLRVQIESGLNSLSRLSGDPKALDLQLNFKGGFMFVGFIPMGPAPRILLR